MQKQSYSLVALIPIIVALSLGACGPGQIYTGEDKEGPETLCGDAVIDDDELCDDGNSNDGFCCRR